MIRPLYTNNSRKFAGKPLHRKGRGKRYKTRCAVWEDICAFFDWLDEV